MQKTSERGDAGAGLFSLGDVVKVMVTLAALVGAFAALSGRWDWWAGWTFLLIFVLYSVSLSVWLSRVDPGLARERAHDADERNQPYERVLLPVMVVLEIGLLVVAALDGGRFGWSHVPVWARAGGWMALTAGGAMLPWVFRMNTFASGVGRIQADRGHAVVSGGPYRFVRHPMYAAIIVVMLGLPLALGSWWALIPGGLLALLFVVRTALEDRMLREELPGYKAYTRRTRYRLIPGIW
jgi:protein-S-isoprenylcysteine O-methyltransferase Ste14